MPQQITLSTEDFHKEPIPPGAYGPDVTDPEYTLKLSVGTVLRITVPSETRADEWKVPEEGDADSDVFSFKWRSIKILPNGQKAYRGLVDKVGKVDLVLLPAMFRGFGGTERV